MSLLRAIQYHAIVHAPDAQGGPGTPKCDLTPHLLNVVWQGGSNLPEMCSFTLARNLDKLASIDWMVDHLKLYRETAAGVDPIFAGKLVKPMYKQADAVVLCWDYKSFLQLSRTGYRVEYPEKKLGTEIIAPEWVLAKTTTPDSPVEFVATGTIEDPLATDGVTPIKTNEEFGVLLFNRLFVFFQIAEMAMSNTANNVMFEITRTAPHTFNFWKNKGASRPLAFASPGNLADFDLDPGYEQIRNDRASVITDPDTGDQSAVSVEDAASIALYRRLQDALVLPTLLGLTGTASEADQAREGLNRLLQEGIRLPKTLILSPRQGEFSPFRDVDYGDTVRVHLRDDDGSALVDDELRVIQMAGAWSPTAGEALQVGVRAREEAA